MRTEVIAAILVLLAGVNLQAQPFPTMVEIPGLDLRMGATEVTNTQYEAFRPEHKELRGDGGFSLGDNEAVVNVSWYDAVAYCEWLSKQTGKSYRLPTEAEWEFACRAGTSTPYWTGDTLLSSMLKNQKTERNLKPVSLEVAQSPANPFGLYDMHGNVEEWCADEWYYGTRITKGGSHNTPVQYLTSSIRLAALPSDAHTQIGFRVVETDKPASTIMLTPLKSLKVKQKAVSSRYWGRLYKRNRKPRFETPIPFVIPPADSANFMHHNHQPAVTYCPNGDLLAIWFSCENEHDREMNVLCSRLRKGSKRWTPAELFYRIDSRNLTGSSLMTLPDGTLLHFNGIGNSGDWQNLALALRRSSDNGVTWSDAQLIEPRHARRHQVIAGPILHSSGILIQLCDAGAGGQDGTSIHLSFDGGISWHDPWDGSPLPDFSKDTTGTTIAGIHAGIVELEDGSLMALGRGNSINDSMPCSISRDFGTTWTYSASEFPPIGSGQRLILRRLNEGPLMLISFTGQPDKTTSELSKTLGHGLFVALSYDDGKTWPVKKLLTNADGKTYNGGAWTGDFTMTDTTAEPKGYLACTQTPDGTIHLLSSRLHYRFNLKWIEQ